MTGHQVRRRRRERGFSLLEVLVSVTIAGMVFTAILGGVRLHVRSTNTLRFRAEARMTLEEAVARYQLGRGKPRAESVAGRYGTYEIRFVPITEERNQRFQGPAVFESRGSRAQLPFDASTVPKDVERHRVWVEWTEVGRPMSLSLDVWRRSPPELGRIPSP